MTIPIIINKVSKVMIKTEELLNVKTIEWKNNSRLIEIPIPGGDIKYQNLSPHQIIGTIVCLDVTSLWTCFYDSNIVDEETGLTTVFSIGGDEFEVTTKDISNNEVIYNFWNVRIQTIDPSTINENINEITWTIKFTASKIVKE